MAAWPKRVRFQARAREPRSEPNIEVQIELGLAESKSPHGQTPHRARGAETSRVRTRRLMAWRIPDQFYIRSGVDLDARRIRAPRPVRSIYGSIGDLAPDTGADA